MTFYEDPTESLNWLWIKILYLIFKWKGLYEVPIMNSSLERNTYIVIKIHFKIVCIDTARK